jgi:inner membrane protein
MDMRFDGVMSIPNLLTGHRATFKLMFIAALSLAMLIPLAMVRSVISDRQTMRLTAESTIAERWGAQQVLGGLMMLSRLPVEYTVDGKVRTQHVWHASAQANLDISADLVTEMRYLGVYELPVYTARVTISGALDNEAADRLRNDGELRLWLPVGDVRGVREISALTIGGHEIPAEALDIPAHTPAGQHQGLQFTIRNTGSLRTGSAYSLTVKLAGSRALMFLPMAERTEVRLRSDWPHPEFIGQFLPVERTISDAGSDSTWQLLGINRPYGRRVSLRDMAPFHLSQAGFGVRLHTPADSYQRSERSVKYGVLFIALTFFILFLFEVMTGRPLHPVPYILTGAALAVFYLLLVALSEFIAFAAAFVVAAAALVTIVGLYTGVVLRRRRRGVLVGTMLALIYGLLYVLVSTEYASLLVGSIALLAAIAGLMFITRGIDWYSYQKDDQAGSVNLRKSPGR